MAMALLWLVLLGATAEESRFGRDGRLWHLKTLPRPELRSIRSPFALRSSCVRKVTVPPGGASRWCDLLLWAPGPGVSWLGSEGGCPRALEALGWHAGSEAGRSGFQIWLAPLWRASLISSPLPEGLFTGGVHVQCGDLPHRSTGSCCRGLL